MADFRETYGTGTGLKSADSLRIGISSPLSSEGTDAERGGGRRRRETTGFYTPKSGSEIESTRWGREGLRGQT